MKPSLRAFAELLLLLWLAGCATPPQREEPAKAQAVDPWIAAQYEASLELLQAGKYEAAAEGFRSIIARDPGLSGPHANLGVALAGLGREEEAIQALRKAVEGNPMNVQAWNVLGLLLRKAGRFDEARRAYEAAIKADPFYANAYRNLGILYDLYLQKPAQARHYYERYLVLAPAEEKTVRGWLADLQRRTRSQ